MATFAVVLAASALIALVVAALQWRDAQASAAAYGAGLAVVCVLRGLALAASPTVVAAGSANALLWALMLRFGRSLLASSAPSTPLLGEHAVLCAAQTAVRAINAAASALDGRDAMALLRASLLRHNVVVSGKADKRRLGS